MRRRSSGTRSTRTSRTRCGGHDGRREITIPDIGDFDGVPVIELLVKVGDKVAVEQSLLVLETDKATMEIPSPAAGSSKLLVGVGDEVRRARRSPCSTSRRTREGRGARRREPAEARPRPRKLLAPAAEAAPEPAGAGDRRAAAEPAPSPADLAAVHRGRAAARRTRGSIGATARARTRRRSRARSGSRSARAASSKRTRRAREGADRAGRRAARRSPADRGYRGGRRVEIDFAKFGRPRSKRSRGSQRRGGEPAPLVGHGPARHAVRRSRRHRPRGVPQAANAEHAGAREAHVPAVPREGRREGAAGVSALQRVARPAASSS